MTKVTRQSKFGNGRKVDTLFAFGILAFGAMAGTLRAEDAYVLSNGHGGTGVGVNTGYHMTLKSRIEVDFQYPETPTDMSLFGAWGIAGGATANPKLRTLFWNSGGKFQFILKDDVYESKSTGVNLDAARHTAIIDVPNLKCWMQNANGDVEGSVLSFAACTNTASLWPVVLFGCAKDTEGNGQQHVTAKIYSVKIYETENGTTSLVHDLVPAVKGDAAGFYDNKTGSFLYGSGVNNLVCYGQGVKIVKDDGYLETPSSNYSSNHISFNTGYFMKPESRIEVDYQWLGTPKDLLFGAWDSGAVLRSGFWINANYFSFMLGEGSFRSYGTTIYKDNHRHTAIIDAKNRGFRLMQPSGSVEWSDYMDTNTYACAQNAQWPVVLFGAAKDAAGTGQQWSYARIFSAKIYENDVLVTNFVPHVQGTSVGFMEKKSGTFKAISGINYGGEVEGLPSTGNDDAYIEGNGTTCLNLGYLANMSSRIEVDFQSLNNGAGKVLFGSWAGGSLRYAFWSNSNGNKFHYIFRGNSQNDPQYVTSSTHDNLRHTAIVDMKNRMMYFITGSTTNYSKQADVACKNGAAPFAEDGSDVSTIPLAIFGYIKSNGTPDMQAKARIYSVRIYEDEVLKHEFLPGGTGSAVGLYDLKTGAMATKVVASAANPKMEGFGVDGSGATFYVQPQGCEVPTRRTATLTAFAAGAYSYQWYADGVAIPGETGMSYTVDWRSTKETVSYTVRACFNAAGTYFVESDPAAVTFASLGMTILFR